jgi:hypothetical protein
MTLLGRMRGLMVVMALVCISTCACNRCTSSLDAGATGSPSAPSVSDAYDIVSRRLQHLERFRAPSTGIIRCVPGNTLAVEVDDKLRVHALRADWPERHYNYDAVLVPMLYGIIDTEAHPQWRKVAEIDYPESPILLLDGVQTIAAILGTTTGKKSRGAGALLLLPLNPLDAGAEPKPALCINRAGATVRPTIDENGRVLAVTHEEYDPIEDRYAAGLRVIRCHDGTGEVLSPLIPGTLHEKTFPQDYAIHVGATGEIYIVYEGVRSDAEAEGSQLWRLTLDSKGKLIESKSLARGVDLIYGLWLLAAPDGQLHAFELYGTWTAPNTTSDKLNYRILPLGVMGRKKGSALNFVVDSWIQPHAIWFENSEPKHRGPDTIPPGKTP